MLLIETARAFAAERHGEQRRKYTDEPYLVHLETVAELVHEYGNAEPHIIAAAYLHDVVEDTDTTMSDVLRRFGEEVAELVYWLTDAETGNRKTRMAMSAWRLGRAPWEAKLIKLADIIDNCRNITEHDPKFAPVFLGEKRAVMAQMVKVEGDRITNHPLFQMAAALVIIEP
jgi:(p)ppGpp synthase/HD superfamily hydrolase